MGIFEDIQKLKEYALNEKMQPTVYVVSPQEYKRELERQIEKELGIKRPRRSRLS